MITNYDRYFGTPAKAADSISRLVDYHDVSCKTGGEGEQYRSEFTDHFRLGGDCEYGLIHEDTLADWLEREWDGWTLQRDSEYLSESCKRSIAAAKENCADLLQELGLDGSNPFYLVQKEFGEDVGSKGAAPSD